MRLQSDMATRLLTLSTVALAAGCAPFAVNWYVDVPADSAKGDVLIAVANRSGKTCTVDKIVLNAAPDGQGYTWPTGPDARAVTLRPGALAVVPLSKFERPKGEQAFDLCVLPSSIAVIGACSWVLPTPGPSLPMNAGLPSLLPDIWRDCLRSTKSPDPSASTASPP